MLILGSISLYATRMILMYELNRHARQGVPTDPNLPSATATLDFFFAVIFSVLASFIETSATIFTSQCGFIPLLKNIF
jgi:hypothetical protein